MYDKGFQVLMLITLTRLPLQGKKAHLPLKHKEIIKTRWMYKIASYLRTVES